MELSHNNRIYFEPVSHTYMLDGDTLLMGVTELMRKHNLGADYSRIPDKVLAKAAEEGTAIHKELQDYENGEAFFSNDLIDEYKELRLKFVESEYPVSDYQTVASAIDMVYEGERGVILVDIKTTEKYHKRALEWQLGCYSTFFRRQNPDIPVDGCFCLWIDKKKRSIRGLIPVTPVSDEEVDALLDAERNGLIYIDENDRPSAEIVLSSSEIAEYANNIEAVQAFKAKIAEIEAKLKEYDEKLLQYMLDNNILEMESPNGVFKVKAGYTRTTVDTAKFKSQFPQLYESMSKTAQVKPSLIYTSKK